MSIAKYRPHFSEQDAGRLAKELYGITASARQLPSERDQNFHLTSESGWELVLKISSSAESWDVLDFQNKAIERLANHSQIYLFPRVCATLSGEHIAPIKGRDGSTHFVRMLTYLSGNFFADAAPHTPELLRDLGRLLGTMDQAFEGFSHSAMHRDLNWNMKSAAAIINRYKQHIANPARRAIVEGFLAQFERDVAPVLPHLRTSVIHNDGNDYNVLVTDVEAESTGLKRKKVSGIIDFGDMLHSYTVCELAIGAAYAILGKANPLSAAAHVVSGYNEVFPLTEQEFEVLYTLMCIRLCVSVALSAYQQKQEPDNSYLVISEVPAWTALEKLAGISSQLAGYTFRHACKLPAGPESERAVEWLSLCPDPSLILGIPAACAPVDALSREDILGIRAQHIGPSLSISYKKPLHIVRGYMQYLYDEDGRAYLDAVNNVPNVGHCHPRVVEAAQRQIAVLNTNTRYLHENLARYAQRLCALLPEPLRVCFFVCTGSEANDLALRVARAHTNQRDIVVVDGAYHGNLSSLIEISPYKFDGPGGSGTPPHVHKVVMPDVYRGPYKAGDPDAGEKYARHVQAAVRQVQQSGRNVAAFICESLLGCGGQIVLPDNYLEAAYRHVREAGGVCIADEVQVGFGRVGSHFWGFQLQGVVPDIVTLGKPIGNGHPLAAVVTRPEIAASFDNGMEYFNTYGGNPVSCAVGLAVLNVIKDEKLQENALRVGARLKASLEQLMDKYSLVGDVRGEGLFIGVELVLDRETLAPAAEHAAYIIERMKENGVLISTDGPLHNVLKIKPPLVFSEENADLLVNMLDRILEEDALELA